MDTDWTELYSEKHKRKYWKHKVDGKISWKAPSQSENEEKNEAKSAPEIVAASRITVDEEWTELYSEKHKKKYWKNKTTGKTSWSAPAQGEPVSSTGENEASHIEAASTSAAVTPAVTGDEWEELFSEKHKKKYWKNKTTGKTSWTAPEKTPIANVQTATATETATAETSSNYNGKNHSSEWEELYSEKHKKKYWKNRTTGKTSWADPSILKVKEAVAKPEEAVPQPVPANAASKAEVAAAPPPVPAAVVTEDEWEELFNQKHQRKYWKNKSTGKSSWTNPAAASAVTGKGEEEPAKAEEKGHVVTSNPAAMSGARVSTDSSEPASAQAESVTAGSAGEWQESFSQKHGKKFWKNSVTGKTSWAPPVGKTDIDSDSAAVRTATKAALVEVSAPSVTAIAKSKPTLPPAVAPVITVSHEMITAPTSAENVAAPSSSSKLVAAELVGQSTGQAYEYTLRGCAVAVIVAVQPESLEHDNEMPSSSWLQSVEEERRTFFELRSDHRDVQLELKSLDLDLDDSNNLQSSTSFTAQSLLSKMKSVKVIPFEAIKSVTCNQSYGEVSVEVGEQRGGFICSFKFDSLKLAQVWFGVLQSRAASVAKYSTIVFIDKSSDSAPWECVGEEVGLLLAMHSLDLEHKHSLLAEAQWIRSSSIIEWGERKGLSSSFTTTSTSSLIVDDLIDHSTLTLAKIKSSVFQPSPQLGASKLQSRHGGMRRSFAQASLESKEHHDISCSFQGTASLGIAPKQSSCSGRGDEESIKRSSDDPETASDLLWSRCSLAMDRHDHLLYVLDYGRTASAAASSSLRRGGKGSGIAFDFVGTSLAVQDLHQHVCIRVTDVKVASVSKDVAHSNPEIMRSLSEGYVDIGIEFDSARDFFLFCTSVAASVSSFQVYRFGTPVELSLNNRMQNVDRYIQHTVDDVISEVTTALAERSLIALFLRRSKINGKQFRTAKFVELNDRVVVVDSGDCQVELPQGSILISVNGLSTRHRSEDAASTPPSSSSSSALYSALNFIANFPLAMTATVQLIRFPAARFLVSVCIPPPTSQGAGDGSSMVWANKVISIESGFIQLLGRSSYPASSCTVTTKSSVDSETALYSFIAEISDTKTGKIHFIASCPYSDHDKFLSLAEALQVAIHLHTLSWKALASAVEYSERKKTVKRTRALTPSILPSIQTRISENISTPIQNASIQSESDDVVKKEKDSNAVKFSIYRAVEALESTLSGLQLPSGCVQFPSVESVVAALSEVAAIQAHNFKMVAELIVWQHRSLLAASAPSETTALDRKPFKGDSEVAEPPGSTATGPASIVLPDAHLKRKSSKAFSQMLDAPPLAIDAAATRLSPPPDGKVVMLGAKERRHIANVVYCLIRSPKAVVSICKRLKSATEIQSFAHLIASRLLHPCSTESFLLGEFVGGVAAIESLEGENYLVNNKASKVAPAWDRSNAAARFDHSQLLGDRAQKSVLLLPYLVVEMGRHFEVEAFVRHMCSDTVDAFVDGLVAAGKHLPQVAVLELTAKIVEPVCNQLHVCIAEGVFPSYLQTVAVALTCSATSPEPLISANAAVAEFIVPNVMEYIKLKIGEKLRYATDSTGEDDSSSVKQQLDQMLQRLQYLFYSTFGAALHTPTTEKDKFSLCLADVAALSRSKWFIARAMEAIHYRTSATPTHPIANKSPVAALAQFNSTHGRMEVLYGVVCLLPSEVAFLVFDVMGLVGSPNPSSYNVVRNALAAVADSVDEALTYLSSSEQMRQLHRSIRVEKIDLDQCAAYCFHTDTSCLLYDAMDAALHPDMLCLDSNGHIQQEPGSDPSASIAGCDFEVDRDRKESFSRWQVSAQEQLTNLGWLVSAARSTLQAVQRQHDHDKPSAEEILELKRSLQAKQEMVLATFKDLERVHACKAWCQNLGTQIRVVLESWRAGALHARLDATKDATLWRLQGNQIQWDYALRNDEGRSAQVRSAQKIIAASSSPLAMQYGRSTIVGNAESKTASYTTPFKVIGKNSPIDKGRSPFVDNYEKMLSVGGPNPLWIIMQNVFPSPKTKL